MAFLHHHVLLCTTGDLFQVGRIRELFPLLASTDQAHRVRVSGEHRAPGGGLRGYTTSQGNHFKNCVWFTCRTIEARLGHGTDDRDLAATIFTPIKGKLWCMHVPSEATPQALAELIFGKFCLLDGADQW
jgi:hypothetical protein